MTRPGRLRDAVQRLKLATRDLQRHWTDTRRDWNDDTARQFESKCLEPILPTLRTVITATNNLEEVYQHAIKQCGDEAEV